jgi:hypothetical protein
VVVRQSTRRLLPFRAKPVRTADREIALRDKGHARRANAPALPEVLDLG